MKIGEIAKQSGFSRDTLRYYEKIGLIQLTKEQRGENNYRIYDGRILKELALIRDLKKVGFTLSEIKTFKNRHSVEELTCATVGPIVTNKLEQIEQQLVELEEQKRNLLTMMRTCLGNCTETFKEVVQ